MQASDVRQGKHRFWRSSARRLAQRDPGWRSTCRLGLAYALKGRRVVRSSLRKPHISASNSICEIGQNRGSASSPGEGLPIAQSGLAFPGELFIPSESAPRGQESKAHPFPSETLPLAQIPKERGRSPLALREMPPIPKNGRCEGARTTTGTTPWRR